MNYLLEINAFYDWLETNPLGASCIDLWHALMHIANKAGWPDTFAVAISVLELKTGLKRDAIYDARNKLQQAGRIKWSSRKGNQSAVYHIIPLVSEIPTQITIQIPTQQPIQQTIQTTTINKLNKTKPYKKPTFNNFKGRQYDTAALKEKLLRRSIDEI